MKLSEANANCRTIRIIGFAFYFECCFLIGVDRLEALPPCCSAKTNSESRQDRTAVTMVRYAVIASSAD
jgi:hypothetical protein